MTIVVCIKHVPAGSEPAIHPVSKKLVRDTKNGKINPYDLNALEEALRLKDKSGARVVAVCMGSPNALASLREALAMGCDEAILANSPGFAGADTLATAYVLSRVIDNLGGASLIFAGRNSVDADTGQVGPILAEFLNLPQVTYAKELELAAERCAEVTRLLDGREEKVRVTLPAVITVTGELNTPRYMTPLNIRKACGKTIKTLGEKELNCEPERIGEKGSPTLVTSVFAAPKAKVRTEFLSDRLAEAAAGIYEILSGRKLV